MSKPVGVVGLGRMGGGIARRLAEAGQRVYGYDPSVHAQTPEGVVRVASLAELYDAASCILLLLPAGEVIDQVLVSLAMAAVHASRGPCFVVDCGNSLYTDTIARHEALKHSGIVFSDAGVSGGVQGAIDGYCVMAGGTAESIQAVSSYLQLFAMPGGYAHVGGVGAGHYVKMVHNAIEYGLLQAYAEGFHMLSESTLVGASSADIAALWQHGSVIRSHLLHLLQGVVKDEQRIAETSGVIHENGTGRWALAAAEKQKIKMPVIAESLAVRSRSRETGGDYATKLVALLRNAFGGHAVEKERQG
ncbi:MAG: NADP-dependent phosphogluconate dehydrogenase [bacterium]|jgi:6-phosphogluconate dehydrogenase